METADDTGLRRTAENGAAIDALTGLGNVGSSIRAHARQLPARDVEQLVSGKEAAQETWEIR